MAISSIAGRAAALAGRSGRVARAFVPAIEGAADRIAWLQGELGSVRGAAGVAEKLEPLFLREARSRGRSAPFKELMNKIEYEADPLRERLVAEQLGYLHKAGLKSAPQIEKESLLADRIRGRLDGTPLSAAMRDEFRRMRGIATKVGMDFGDLGEKYFPNMMKDDIAAAVFDDLAPLESRFKSLGVTDDVINSTLKEMIQKNDLSGATAKVLQHVVETKQVKDMASAMRLMRRESGHSIFAESGWEKPRKLDLPLEMWENDATKVMRRYVESWGKRVAETTVFGAKGERAEQLLNAMADQGGINEARLGRHILDAWSGDIEFKKSLPTWAKKWSDRYTSFAVLTKIGFGFGALKNIFQTAVSTAEYAGWARTLRGLYDLVQTPGHRALVDESGAMNRLALESLAGFMSPSKSARIAEKGLKYSGFHGINVGNQYLAGSVALRFVPELYELANGRFIGAYQRMMSATPGLKVQRTAWAKRMLSDMGVDWRKPLTKDQINTGVYRFATDTQLQKNVVRDPISRSDPRYRPLWALKGFGIRQYHFQKNLLMRETAKGNLFPLLRLGTGGVVAGAIEQEIEKIVRAFLNGKPPQESDKSKIALYFSHLAAVGAWPYMVDVAAAEDKLRAVGFLMTPIQVSEFTRGVEMLERVWQDADMNAITSFSMPVPKKSIGQMLQSRIQDAASFAGTVPRELAKRGKTPEQEKAALSRDVAVVKEKIFRAALANDLGAIDRVYDAWQNNHPERPLTYHDVGPREFSDWLIERGKIDRRSEVYGLGVTIPSQQIMQQRTGR